MHFLLLIFFFLISLLHVSNQHSLNSLKKHLAVTVMQRRNFLSVVDDYFVFFGCFHPATAERITKWWNLSSPVSAMRAAQTKLPLRRRRRVMKLHLKLWLIIVVVSSAASLRWRELIKCKAFVGDCVVHVSIVHSSHLICGRFTERTETHSVVVKH